MKISLDLDSTGQLLSLFCSRTRSEEISGTGLYQPNVLAVTLPVGTGSGWLITIMMSVGGAHVLVASLRPELVLI